MSYILTIHVFIKKNLMNEQHIINLFIPCSCHLNVQVDSYTHIVHYPLLGSLLTHCMDNTNKHDIM